MHWIYLGSLLVMSYQVINIEKCLTPTDRGLWECSKLFPSSKQGSLTPELYKCQWWSLFAGYGNGQLVVGYKPSRKDLSINQPSKYWGNKKWLKSPTKQIGHHTIVDQPPWQTSQMSKPLFGACFSLSCLCVRCVDQIGHAFFTWCCGCSSEPKSGLDSLGTVPS